MDTFWSILADLWLLTLLHPATMITIWGVLALVTTVITMLIWRRA
jgi:hypothetical protein